jgi:hypothetical protein
MNKNIYYPTYTINPQSIYGSGIVDKNNFPTTDTTTSVITDSFPNNRSLTPPLYRSGVAQKPLDTNGYRKLKKPFGINNKKDNYYYSSQQNNDDIIPIIKPTFREKLKNKILNVSQKIVDDDFDNIDNDEKINKKDNENTENNDEDIKDIENIINEVKKVNENKQVDEFGRNKKMWLNDHYLYGLEPRYSSVINPWRAYTWMYPITPNTDNYYIDNINSSPTDPIIVSNDTTNNGNYQSTYLKSNMLKENYENYEIKKYGINYNILYFIIIVLILSIYFYKD